MYVNASCRRSARCLDVLSFLPFGIMRSYPGFCRRKQLEYNPGLTHRRRAGHPRANRRTSDRPSFCGVRLDPAQNAARGSDFNPRTPCGVRLEKYGTQIEKGPNFNPRTPCGVRPSSLCEGQNGRYFNPRTPCGVRLDHGFDIHRPYIISIHAPLAGCDRRFRLVRDLLEHFNPRTPCGVRPVLDRYQPKAYQFQSTHPLRGATQSLQV